MTEDFHCYWKNDGTENIFVRVMNRKVSLCFHFVQTFVSKNIIIVIFTKESKEEYTDSISTLE